MYDKQEVLNAITKLKSINKTVDKKNLHKTKLEELRKLLHEFMAINKYLFEPEFHYGFCQYSDAIKMNKTKKELDSKLNYCIVSVGNGLVGIIRTIETCHYDEKQGKYIEVRSCSNVS